MNYHEIIYGENVNKYNLITLPYNRRAYDTWRTDHPNNDFVSCRHKLFNFEKTRQARHDRQGTQFFYSSVSAPTSGFANRYIETKIYVEDIKYAYRTIMKHLFGNRIKRYKINLAPFMVRGQNDDNSCVVTVDLVDKDGTFNFNPFTKKITSQPIVEGWNFLDVLNYAYLLETAATVTKRLHGFKNSEEIKLYVLAWFQMHNDYLVLASEHILLKIVNSFVYEHHVRLKSFGELSDNKQRKQAVFDYLGTTDTVKYLDRPYV